MNRKGDKSLIVGLDIGTSKVTALAGEYSPGHEIEVIGRAVGRPVLTCRPLIVMLCSRPAQAEPICILISSAVRSPIIRLWCLRRYEMMASFI